MSESTTPRLATTAEAALYLGCSVSFLATDRMSGRYKIPFSRIGRVVRYDLRELDQWLKANRELDPARG